MKAYLASPPDVLRVDEKNLHEYNVFNCCGVILTTNHKTDGIYLPADDRRHYVAWSDLTKDDSSRLLDRPLALVSDGGDHHVAAYLVDLDLQSSTRRRRRQRPKRSGTSSTPTARPKTANWPTRSSGSEIPMLWTSTPRQGVR